MAGGCCSGGNYWLATAVEAVYDWLATAVEAVYDWLYFGADAGFD